MQHQKEFLKDEFIRISAWFTFIFFALISITSLFIIYLENFDFIKLSVFLLSVLISITGFFARKIGLDQFRLYKLAKPFAVFSLVFGILFSIVAPLFFVVVFGVMASFEAILALVIMFIPAVVSSSAILFLKRKTNRNVQTNF
ncbi:hypothetical protein [Algoriphagus litoralis]|uniref:hypothetical protein n=1 Tax=Algoriphagus litoralis TaxID=2202829 RepID=UPI000DBA03B3|nr:hypothetical protein [Algoriphagus litoralis]